MHGQTRLTNNTALDEPRMVTNGAQSAFASNRDSGNFDIFVRYGGRVHHISKGVQAEFGIPLGRPTEQDLLSHWSFKRVRGSRESC